jgi:hypothetical protein
MYEEKESFLFRYKTIDEGLNDIKMSIIMSTIISYLTYENIPRILPYYH